MTLLTADVEHSEVRDRVTVGFRFVLAIPHAIVLYAWTLFAEILAFVEWFIVLFTGRRNRGIWDLQWSWLQYSSRVTAYQYLLFDPYPPFGAEQGPTPMTVHLEYEEEANRLTNGLRFIWAIPALIVAAVLGIGVFVVVVVSWFAIVITGRQSRGMFDFVLTGTRYILQTNAYVMLMTDTYPKWGSGAEIPIPPRPAGGSPLPPPTMGGRGPLRPPTAPPA
jgi:hypothetical protein